VAGQNAQDHQAKDWLQDAQQLSPAQVFVVARQRPQSKRQRSRCARQR